MSQDPVKLASEQIDLSDRFAIDNTVDASPAAAAETIIAHMTIPANLRAGQKVILWGYASFTVGTNGTAARLRIRETDASGTVVADTDAITAVAAEKRAYALVGYDTAQVTTGQTYVLTLQVTAGSAVSTVSNVVLAALVI